VSTSDEIQALRSRVIETVYDIVNERRPVAEAAHELDRLRVDLVRLEVALRPFVGIAAEWDCNPERRSEIEDGIISAAESLRRNLES
jgi:hypothetical protein